MKVIITGKRTIGWVIKGENKIYDNVKDVNRKTICGEPCTIIYPNYGGELIFSEKNYNVSVC